MGNARFPGTCGPYPRRPAEKVAAAAPEVIPCQDWSKATISWRPVESLASLTAASFDSAPVVSSSVRVSGSGSVSARRTAKSTTGWLTMPE